MLSAELSRLVRKVVAYPPLSEIATLTDGSSTRRCSTPTPLRTCPGSGRAAILRAEQNRPKLRVVGRD
jgi:hypothetical protein